MARPRQPANGGPSLRSRLLRSVFAPLLSVCVVATSLPQTATAAVAPDTGEIERLYLEAQERDEAKDYKGSADSWTRLLAMLPESGDNQAIRETVVINLLSAHIKAYNQLVDDKGNKDISHLENGKLKLDGYYAEFKAVHGDRVAVSAAVQEKAAQLEKELEKAKTVVVVTPPKTDPKEPGTKEPAEPLPDDGPKVVVLKAQNNGTGLIVGGAVVGVLGLGALAMIPIGSIRGKNADEEHSDLQEKQRVGEATQEQVDLALKDGQQANQILIAGAILAPLFLGGAAAMIVFGIKARRESQAKAIEGVSIDRISPQVGRSYAGFGLSGRF